MAVRTTADAVKLILEPTFVVLATDAVMTWAIDFSTGVVDSIEAAGDLSAAALEKIERLLSAHFFHITYTRADQEKAGSVAQRLRSKVDLGLNLTHYGQMAMFLDTTGTLKQMNEPKPANLSVGVTWLGEESDS